MTVTSNAQKIAEELGHDGSHPFAVTVTAAGKEIASWREDPEQQV